MGGKQSQSIYFVLIEKKEEPCVGIVNNENFLILLWSDRN